MDIKRFTNFLVLIQFFTVVLTVCLFNCSTEKDSTEKNSEKNSTEKNSTEKNSTRSDLPADAKARFGRGTIVDIAYSPDGMHITISSYVGTWIYHVQRGEVLAFPTVSTLRFSPDGSTLATGNADGTVRLWDVATGTLKHSLIGDRNRIIMRLRFSPDGSTLATGSADGTVRLWDVATGTLKHSLTGDLNRVICVSDFHQMAARSQHGIWMERFSYGTLPQAP